MYDDHLPSDVRSTAAHVTRLCQSVEFDEREKARLRQELIRHHQRLTMAETWRTAEPLWRRLRVTKHLRHAAPQAMAIAAGVALLLGVFGGIQHQTAHPVQAAEISRALAHAAPTVTSWRVSVQRVRGSTASASRCSMPLQAGHHLYMKDGRTYLFSSGRWWQLTSDLLSRQCPSELQWPFAGFAGRLASNHVTILSGYNKIGGRTTVRVTYSSSGSAGSRIDATAWVDRDTGLVLRMERVVFRGPVVVERSWADYQYQYGRTK